MPHLSRHAPLALAAFLALSSCLSLDYDLSAIPVPISAKPADANTARVEPFEIEARNTLWVHGLLGQSEPDVGALLAERIGDADRVASFRVRQTGTIHDWFITHLSLTLVRSKKVIIEGELVHDSELDR